MKQLFQDLCTLCLNAILPVRCVVCKQQAPEALCAQCVAKCAPARQRCFVCRKSSPFGLTHPSCATRTSPVQSLALFDYANAAVSESIIMGKYNLIPDVFRVLGKQCASLHTLAVHTTEYALCPIPLHPSRLRWRGFNQLALVATTLAEQWNVPYTPILRRTKRTTQQKNLNATARKANVADCCQVDPNAPLPAPTTHIVLIDDVSTTGNTLHQAIRALQAAGFRTISCLCIANE